MQVNQHYGYLVLLSTCIIVFTNNIFSQKVGIGTNTPAQTLHVLSTLGHTARFEGSDNMFISFYENGDYRGYLGSYAGANEDVDFGTGAGNFTGKLHLTTLASPKLTIAANGNVGIGTVSPLYKMHINGSTDIEGTLYLKGNSGVSGQVLTSNGGASPSWQNTALSNAVRFGARYQRVGLSGTALSLQTNYYNLSPADVNLATNNIAINKSGLYRINGYITGLIQGNFTQLPEMTCDLNFSGAFSAQYDLLQWHLMPKRTQVNNNYYEVIPYELDIYLPAGTFLGFNISYLADNTITYQEGNIRVFGYLISD